MVRSALFSPHASPRPDPARIAAICAAILGNVAIFALLMRPIDLPTPSSAHERVIPVRFVPPPPPRLKPPVVPVRPDLPPAAVVKPAPIKLQPLPQVPTRQQTTPMSIPVVAPPPVSTQINGGHDVASPTTMETALVPIASPAPIYPRQALIDGIGGTVVLELLVDVDGHVISARIVHSSGDRRLDAAARDTIVRGWRFTPALRDGKPIQARGQVPVVFRLDDTR